MRKERRGAEDESKHREAEKETRSERTENEPGRKKKDVRTSQRGADWRRKDENDRMTEQERVRERDTRR